MMKQQFHSQSVETLNHLRDRCEMDFRAFNKSDSAGRVRREQTGTERQTHIMLQGCQVLLIYAPQPPFFSRSDVTGLIWDGACDTKGCFIWKKKTTGEVTWGGGVGVISHGAQMEID